MSFFFWLMMAVSTLIGIADGDLRPQENMCNFALEDVQMWIGSPIPVLEDELPIRRCERTIFAVQPDPVVLLRGLPVRDEIIAFRLLGIQFHWYNGVLVTRLPGWGIRIV